MRTDKANSKQKGQSFFWQVFGLEGGRVPSIGREDWGGPTNWVRKGVGVSTCLSTPQWNRLMTRSLGLAARVVVCFCCGSAYFLLLVWMLGGVIFSFEHRYWPFVWVVLLVVCLCRGAKRRHKVLGRSSFGGLEVEVPSSLSSRRTGDYPQTTNLKRMWDIWWGNFLHQENSSHKQSQKDGPHWCHRKGFCSAMGSPGSTNSIAEPPVPS